MKTLNWTKITETDYVAGDDTDAYTIVWSPVNKWMVFINGATVYHKAFTSLDVAKAYCNMRSQTGEAVTVHGKNNYCVNGYYDCDNCGVAEPYGEMYSWHDGAICAKCADTLAVGDDRFPDHP